MLEGKVLYRESCIQKNAWNAPLPEMITNQRKKWEKSLPEVSVKRSILLYQQEIDKIELHAFEDASGHGVCASVYAVVLQDLVTAKSRLAKQGLTIPCLELVSEHMAVNLAINVHQALEGLPLATTLHCWLDCSVALHWIGDQGEYRWFISNCVKKIQTHPNVLWHHVPSADNPANLGSRGGSVTGVQLWWNGSTWLVDPPEVVTKPSPESLAERKVQQEVFALGVEGKSDHEVVLEMFDLKKALRIGAWVARFLRISQVH